MTIAHHPLPVEQGYLPLTIARAQGTGAAVVIMPSAFGVTPDLETQMKELAEEASLVFAIDPFFRQDAGPASYNDMPRAMARIQALDRARAQRDLRAAIEWARGQNGGQAVVVLGICFGGVYALLAAADGAARRRHHVARLTDEQLPRARGRNAVSHAPAFRWCGSYRAERGGRGHTSRFRT